MHRFAQGDVIFYKHVQALSSGWGMSWVRLLRNVKPDHIFEPENSAFDEKPGAGP